MKYKWTYEENKSFRQILIILFGETLSGEIFVRQNYSLGKIFFTFQKIRHFRPTKFRPIKFLAYIFGCSLCISLSTSMVDSDFSDALSMRKCASD